MAPTAHGVAISTILFDGHPLPVALEQIATVAAMAPASTHFVYVELAHITGYSESFDESVFAAGGIRTAREALAMSGLQCYAVSAHMQLTDGDAIGRIRRRIEYAAALGAKQLVTNAGHQGGERALIDVLEAVYPDLHSSGLTLALENPGDGRPSMMDHGSAARRTIDRIHHHERIWRATSDLRDAAATIRCNYDPGNLATHAPQRDPVADLQPVLPVLAHIHCKDVSRRNDGLIGYCAIGAGTIDYTRILRALHDAGWDGTLGVEIPLRLRRSPTGTPQRAGRPVTLSTAANVLRESLAFIARVQRDHI